MVHYLTGEYGMLNPLAKVPFYYDGSLYKTSLNAIVATAFVHNIGIQVELSLFDFTADLHKKWEGDMKNAVMMHNKSLSLYRQKFINRLKRMQVCNDLFIVQVYHIVKAQVLQCPDLAFLLLKSEGPFEYRNKRGDQDLGVSISKVNSLPGIYHGENVYGKILAYMRSYVRKGVHPEEVVKRSHDLLAYYDTTVPVLDMINPPVRELMNLRKRPEKADSGMNVLL